MKNTFTLRSTVIRCVFALGLCALISCQTPNSTGGTSSSGSASGSAGSVIAKIEDRAAANNGPTRDLSQDEAAGGHILRKHVGQTDDELRERLERERRITGASTYTDRSSAEHAVGAAIAASEDRIERWLNRSGG